MIISDLQIPGLKELAGAIDFRLPFGMKSPLDGDDNGRFEMANDDALISDLNPLGTLVVLLKTWSACRSCLKSETRPESFKAIQEFVGELDFSEALRRFGFGLGFDLGSGVDGVSMKSLIATESRWWIR